MKVGKLIIADWAIALRSIDIHVVSRYRQAMRTGAKFPPVIVDKKTLEIISGNHRVTAYLAEFGEGYDIEVDLQSFKSHAEQLRVMAEENAKHGMLMDGFTRRKIAAAMIDEGIDTANVAAIFNVPVQVIEKWGSQTVFVIGKGAMPVKFGLDTDTVTKVTKEQYKEHCAKDYGVQARCMGAQLCRWISAGWVNMQDEQTAATFAELKGLLSSIDI